MEIKQLGMDFHDATKHLFDRIKQVEPEQVGKIVGFLLLQDPSEKDMIRLAHSPDKVLEERVQEAKLRLASMSHFISPRLYSSPIPITPNPYWNQQLLNSEEFNRLSIQTTRFPSFEDSSRRSPSLPNFPIKTCHYFNKGFCKHGINCRYLHGGGYSLPESSSNILAPNSNDGDDHGYSLVSLDKLEGEITELLRSKRGNPVSIASLPMMYQEKYGKSLQAEGYLTESQRHGRAGYSLTKLLARLKSIRLFDRPHGQHFVILAEDASKYSIDGYTEKKDPGPIVAGSRQIYLTFPAESTFTEEDVSKYFSNFGPVEDVRIPCQQKRMFGFVTFSCANTVKMVLAKGNPHFVCGARVLVKPYREKSKLIERKLLTDKNEHHMYYHGNYWELDPDIHLRGCEAPRFLRRQIAEEQERALELETRRLSELKLAQNPTNSPPYINYAMEELNSSEDHSKFPWAERFNHLLDVLNNGSTSDHDQTRQTDQESSQAINLPDSPFSAQTVLE